MYNSDELRLFFEKARNGVCSHAYIIDGSDGVGKTEFALTAARAMLCTEKNKPCGYCKSCKTAQSGNHPDIYVVGREKTASIDDVRRLIARASLKPNESDKQIFVICNANKLREEAQNALLKLFEEPPATVAIFLLTESRSSLLPTVLSRGQRIHLDGLRDFELADKLNEKYPSLSDSDINTVTKVASGNYGVAEKYLSKENALLREKAENLLLFALTKKNYELTSALVLPKHKRDQLRAIMIELITVANECEKARYGVRGALTPKNKELAEVAKNASKRALSRIGEAATACIVALDGNQNVTATATKFATDLIKAAAR
jgi:DNA polymerase-3 subunit delta'